MNDNAIKMTYRRKIFLGMLVAAVVPMTLFYLLITMAFGAYSTKSLKQEAYESFQVVENALNTGIDEITGNVERLSENNAVISLFAEDNPKENPSVYRQLYVVNKESGKLADYCLYDKDGKLITYIGSGRNVEDVLSTEWGILFETINYPDNCIIRNAKKYQGAEKEEYLRVGKAITDNNEIKGFVVAVIDRDNMEYILRDTGIEKTGVIRLFDSFDEEIYASMSVEDESDFTNCQKILLKNNAESVEGENSEYMYYHQYDDTYGIHIVFRQYYKDKINLLRQLVIFGGAGAILGIIISFVLSRIFSKRFYTPIEKITKDIDKIGKGDYSARIDISDEPRDEMMILSENINQMAATLEDNTKRLVERERELGNANIKMMQAQLNPHFIYNTLDTIKWMGKVNDVPEVATISSGLAKILRTSINSQQIVTLREEIELVESYVEIQKIRFDDKFEFVVDVPEELMGAKIPKLILQPVIENCIVHGFEERDNGKILISAMRTEKELFLSVRDDGCGIDESELAKLNEFNPPVNELKDEKSGSHIGVYNVHAIIRLHYGKDFGLKIESKVSRGTTVSYNIPYNE